MCYTIWGEITAMVSDCDATKLDLKEGWIDFACALSCYVILPTLLPNSDCPYPISGGHVG